MIEFELTDRQAALRDFVRMFARDVVRPISLQCDREKRVPEDVLLKIVEAGRFQMGSIPKDFGGDDDAPADPRASPSAARRPKQGNRTACIGAEELSWGDAAFLMCLPGPNLGGPPVRAAGTREQIDRFFAIFKEPGLHYGAYALTEPDAGSDVAGIRTTCRKDGNAWVLDGTKRFITNGARADWVVVFATVDRSLGRAGHRAFVVERGTPGFRVGRIEDKIGLRASETAELVFEECRVPADNLLGGEARYQSKEGFMAAMKTFDSSRPMVAAMALGIGRAAFEYARDLLRERYTLTRPVPRYGAIVERLARIGRRLDAARMLVWRAAWMADEGIPNAKEASMSKAAAGQAAVFACTEAIDLCGAAGLLADGGASPDAPPDVGLLEKWFRDIKVFDIFEGTGQIQRIVIAKRILQGLTGF